MNAAIFCPGWPQRNLMAFMVAIDEVDASLRGHELQDAFA